MNYLDLGWKKTSNVTDLAFESRCCNLQLATSWSFWKANGNKQGPVPNGYRTCIYLSHKIQISDSKHVHCVDLPSRMDQGHLTNLRSLELRVEILVDFI